MVLEASDVAHAVRFYVETLGMKLVGEADDGSATIDAGEGFRIELRPRGGSTGPESRATMPGHPIRLSPKVPIDEAIAIYENRGITFTTTQVGSVVEAHFRDPDGNPLALVQTK